MFALSQIKSYLQEQSIQVLQINGDAIFERLHTDTRTMSAESLFIALKGNNFDAHDFVEKAQQAGAVAVMVERQLDINIPQLIVPNTLTALGWLGRFKRLNMTGRWLALTGSNGKTTVKEMLRHILAQAGTVAVTEGNMNNEVGVPLTIWNMDNKGTDYSVLEMGASQLGDIAYTCHIGVPEIGILINAQEAHIGKFGSYEKLMATKGEIIQSLPQQGQVVLNLDDKNYSYWQTLAQTRKVWTCSLNNSKAHVYSEAVCMAPLSSQFTLCIKQQKQPVTLAMPGQHNISNALIAAAAASAAGLTITQIAKGLENCKPYQGRLVQHVLNNQVLVIDDSYNANPTSVKSALDVLASQSGKTCLLLGDMGELGEETIQRHQQVGLYAAQCGIDYLFGVGEWVAYALDEFLRKGGFSGACMTTHAEFKEYLKNLPKENMTYLVKGSRSSHMEKLVTLLLNQLSVQVLPDTLLSGE